MSKKDFVLIAKGIRECEDLTPEGKAEVVNGLAMLFLDANPRFSATKFINACYGL